VRGGSSSVLIQGLLLPQLELDFIVQFFLLAVVTTFLLLIVLLEVLIVIRRFSVVQSEACRVRLPHCCLRWSAHTRLAHLLLFSIQALHLVDFLLHLVLLLLIPLHFPSLVFLSLIINLVLGILIHVLQILDLA
jgi:hypothetical protein